MASMIKSELSPPQESCLTKMSSIPLVPACLAPNTWEPSRTDSKSASDRTDLAAEAGEQSPAGGDVCPHQGGLACLATDATVRLGTPFHVQDPGAAICVAEALSVIAALGSQLACSTNSVSSVQSLSRRNREIDG